MSLGELGSSSYTLRSIRRQFVVIFRRQLCLIIEGAFKTAVRIDGDFWRILLRKKSQVKKSYCHHSVKNQPSWKSSPFRRIFNSVP